MFPWNGDGSKTLVPSEPQFIAGKWMFIPLKMYLYPNPYFFMAYTNYQRFRTASQQLCGAQSRDGHLRPRFPPDGRYQIRGCFMMLDDLYHQKYQHNPFISCWWWYKIIYNPFIPLILCQKYTYGYTYSIDLKLIYTIDYIRLLNTGILTKMMK